jgi:hypothetical protein
MKKMLQIAALFVMAASVVLAAIIFHPKPSEKCNYEWKKSYVADTSNAYNHFNGNKIVLNK